MERMPKHGNFGDRRVRRSRFVTRDTLPVRTHSPEKPDPTCRVAPRAERWPALARQVMISAIVFSEIDASEYSGASAMAAPEARSKD